jgi:hypothetical protein
VRKAGAGAEQALSWATLSDNTLSDKPDKLIYRGKSCPLFTSFIKDRAQDIGLFPMDKSYIELQETDTLCDVTTQPHSWESNKIELPYYSTNVVTIHQHISYAGETRSWWNTGKDLQYTVITCKTCSRMVRIPLEIDDHPSEVRAGDHPAKFYLNQPSPRYSGKRVQWVRQPGMT